MAVDSEGPLRQRSGAQQHVSPQGGPERPIPPGFGSQARFNLPEDPAGNVTVRQLPGQNSGFAIVKILG